MTAAGTLERIVERLRAAGIPHMLAGSFASTYHGTPRTTQDIDLVIDPSHEALERFVAGLPPSEFYVSVDAAREALAGHTQFNVIDVTTGWKIDLIVRRDRAFSVEEFRRRQPARLFEATVDVASAEDTVIAKLEWARLGESERQLRDVAGIIAVQAGALDREYVERWAGELRLLDLWRRALALAGS